MIFFANRDFIMLLLFVPFVRPPSKVSAMPVFALTLFLHPKADAIRVNSIRAVGFYELL